MWADGVMWLWLLPWLLQVRAVNPGQACIDGAVLPDQRANITFDGISMPVGVVMGTWESSRIVAEIYSIIASEVLGFAVHQTVSAAGHLMFMALTGWNPVCNCGFPTRYHVAFEFWRYTYTEEWWTALPGIAPVRAGSLKYAGYDGLFVFPGAHARGLEHGLALEYYRSYNTSWFQPTQHLAKVGQVDLNRLETCIEVWINQNFGEIANAYLAITGDVEGTMLYNNSTVFNCWREKWFVGPGCRHDPGNCGALVSRTGWGLMEVIQKIFFLQMPLAYANAKPEEYVPLNQELQSLAYWWEPDTQFALDNPQLVRFAPHNVEEFRRGIQRTMKEPIPLDTLTAAGWQHALQEVASRVSFTQEEMKELLVNASGSSTRHTACTWIRHHQENWNTWLPDHRRCADGLGVVDAQGDFLLSGENASGCERCPAGRFSRAFATTRVCEFCPPGSFQSLPAEMTCTPCSAGKASVKEGERACADCPLGSFANSTGMSQCHWCGPEDQKDLFTTSQLVPSGEGPTRIPVLGASRSDFCSCKTGMLLNGLRCEPCPLGAVCDGTTQVQLLAGFWSSTATPTSVYFCYNAPEACPGGRPGACAHGREVSNLGCARCNEGRRQRGGYAAAAGCIPCTSTDYMLLCLALVLCIAIIVLCQVVYRHYSLSTALLLSACLLCHQLVMMMTEIGGASWSDGAATAPVEVIQRFTRFLECSPISRRTPLGLFLRPHVPLLVFLFLAVLHLCLDRRRARHLVVNSVGNFAFAYFAMLLYYDLAAFRCFLHPNGLSTLLALPDVLCSGDQYATIVAFGCILVCLPISFAALCFWLLLAELPKRLLAGDMRFIRSCNFLVANFRPGSEVYVALYLARMVLMSLTSFIPFISAKILFMNIWLLGSLVVTAIAKPWRYAICNQLDLLIVAGMLMQLDIGSALLRTLDTNIVVAACMTVASLMSLATLGFGSWGIIQFALLHWRKRFRCIICHHHLATGSYALMLKMELEKQGCKALLDHEPADLAQLVHHVSHNTEALVILGSRELFTLKSCIAEMAVAQVHEVRTVLLAFPSYSDSWESLNADFWEVPEELVAFRIGLHEIMQTHRWLKGLERFQVAPEFATSAAQQVLSFMLPSCELELEQAPQDGADCVILADLSNLEAAATANILRGMLSPLLLERTCEEVIVLEVDTMPPCVMYALVVCSDGCFESLRYASWLLQLRALNGAQVSILAIIAESGFQFPSLSFQQDMMKIPQLQGVDLRSYSKIIQALFGELWFFVTFTPQCSTRKELQLRAAQVRNLLEAARPLAERLAAAEAQKVEELKELKVTDEWCEPVQPINNDLKRMVEVYQMYFCPMREERF
ncbi:unnamed protein product [Effrenium voratum]|nr:unnamed protein product [Effrenium voratum]|mmetsp:Transcript_85380/g.204574  ORF Transcript_85380/g.204574 Transcript_85380/m.204574 type:complete len:1342 (-) Transcript_85380:53-4078(-)